MPGQSDAMVARLERELEEKSTFVDGLIGDAETKVRDRQLVGQANC